MSSKQAEHVLDNPAWYALSTNHAHFAISNGAAKRYPVDVSPILAVASISTNALRDLTAIVAQGETVALGGDDLPSDTVGWRLHSHFPLLQMVSEQAPAEVETSETIVDLKLENVPEMLDLINLTHPGPFLAHTIELGHYIGIYKEGKLVAMAGERVYPPGYREISAVCTNPDYQGKGLAQLLVSRLAAENWQRGVVPFLHVSPENTRARQLYERLGFRLRREVQLLIISY